MPKYSAGILLYRRGAQGIEVLLVHPGGPFWAKKDDGAWSIPKGEIGPDEDPLAAAQREFTEELGGTASGDFVELEPVTQAGGKRVLAWALAGDFDTTLLRSQTFTIEWPPKSGRLQAFPEVDRAGWFDLSNARRKILAGQAPLLDQLAAKLGV